MSARNGTPNVRDGYLGSGMSMRELKISRSWSYHAKRIEAAPTLMARLAAVIDRHRAIVANAEISLSGDLAEAAIITISRLTEDGYQRWLKEVQG